MLAPCEEIYKFYIPALKAKVVHLLAEDYSMTQVQIAKSLGMTQAAVSKCLSGKSSPRVKALMKRRDLVVFAKLLSSEISNKHIGKTAVSGQICSHCASVNFGKTGCGVRELSKTLGLASQ